MESINFLSLIWTKRVKWGWDEAQERRESGKKRKKSTNHELWVVRGLEIREIYFHWMYSSSASILNHLDLNYNFHSAVECFQLGWWEVVDGGCDEKNHPLWTVFSAPDASAVVFVWTTMVNGCELVDFRVNSTPSSLVFWLKLTASH